LAYFFTDYLFILHHMDFPGSGVTRILCQEGQGLHVHKIRQK